jgi:glycosyltransferase involved in cell wall biosynthesis
MRKNPFVVVLASRREGMARCMIEGVACGTPVVSFDVCSAREILEEHDCGRVAPQGEYRQLVRHVEELAASTQERRRLEKNGENTARHLFDPASIVEQYEQLYRELNEQAST